MSLATHTIKKQQRFYLHYLWRGLALMAIGGYCGIMILRDGMGTAVQTGGKANVLVRGLMGWLSERGIYADKLLPLCMVGLFGVIAAVGLFNVARGVWRMVPTHTMFGTFLRTQTKDGEAFADAVDSINADMELEPSAFGTVTIGRKWILDTEPMRLSGIRGVFWFDQAMEDYVLCCVDEDQNIWAASLRYASDRDDAAEHLIKRLPNIATGDKAAYLAFLGGEPASEPEDEGPALTAISLSPETTFCFVGTAGIPTSNFTCETACQALRALTDTQTIALKVLTPRDSTVVECCFTREGGKWAFGVCYRQDDEEHRTVTAVDEQRAITILENLMNQKRLPDFCNVQR